MADSVLHNVTPFPVTDVGGVPFQVSTLEDACDWLLTSAIPRRNGLNVRLANAYNVALASSDSDYKELLTEEGVNFPDGTPVVWFMRLRRGRQRARRVRGPSLFPLTLRESVSHGTKHFFLGGSPRTLSQLEAKVRSACPGIIIAGTYSPPFAAITEAYIFDCAERVRASGADIVWIGLGTPKQDRLGAALAREVPTVSVNVGAAFDFLAGTVREAPDWVQRSGFEWLYRLASEPTRLWRRYLVGNLQFLVAAVSGLKTHDQGAAEASRETRVS